jgi:hypothetical protein
LFQRLHDSIHRLDVLGTRRVQTRSGPAAPWPSLAACGCSRHAHRRLVKMKAIMQDMQKDIAKMLQADMK